MGALIGCPLADDCSVDLDGGGQDKGRVAPRHREGVDAEGVLGGIALRSALRLVWSYLLVGCSDIRASGAFEGDIREEGLRV